MTLNHSRTWPVGTFAVVELRVDPRGRTYSTLMDPQVLLEDLAGTATPRGRAKRAAGAVVLPLSREHLELFTRMSTGKKTTVRTDTISTILDPAEFEEGDNNNLSICPKAAPEDVGGDSVVEKFHVLALSRVEEAGNAGAENATVPEEDEEWSRNGKEIGIGRRPSIKVDNWDFIYTETVGTSTHQARCPIHRFDVSARTPDGARHAPARDSSLPPELPLDARKTTTLRRHYYPEGGWGWVVVVCGVLVHALNHGAQLACSQLVVPGTEKFKVEAVHFAGK